MNESTEEKAIICKNIVADFALSGKSFLYTCIRKGGGSRTDLWGTPELPGTGSDEWLLITTI